jgi:hypothetical protein
MATVITGSGVRDMRELAVKLRAADPKMKRDLRRNFRQLAAPLVRDVQAAILAMPSKDGPPKEGGLRDDIAKTVSASTTISKSGIRLDIVSLGSRMPPGEDSLPKHTDSARGWAHPVFARGERFRLGPSRARKYQSRPAGEVPLVHFGRWTWVREEGRPQWFEGPIGNRARDVQAAAQAAMDSTARMLES